MEGEHMVTAAAPAVKMKAATRSAFGGHEVVEVRDVEKPVPAENELLVRVHAASVNAFDWHMLTGLPYLVRLTAGFRKPKRELLGVDFAGTVEAVGASVEVFRPGDEVFGGMSGAFAEYACDDAGAIAPKPPGVSFEDAAALGIAGVTALQGLRDKGQLRSGQSVLINGASGGVGTFAVQLARWLGAEVTGVCSTGNVETARSLGADHVVDYTREDFVVSGRRYDVMLDIGGNRSWADCRRVLKDGGTLVMVGGPKTNRWVGGIASRFALSLRSRLGRQSAVFFVAKLNTNDLEVLGELLESRTVVPFIDRRYPLAETAEALRYVGQGHARGKVVIDVAG
jgi:NADPH:quinone reductase-like Zn-dependent oxidoreductase